MKSGRHQFAPFAVGCAFVSQQIDAGELGQDVAISLAFQDHVGVLHQHFLRQRWVGEQHHGAAQQRKTDKRAIPGDEIPHEFDRIIRHFEKRADKRSFLGSGNGGSSHNISLGGVRRLHLRQNGLQSSTLTLLNNMCR
jgi:hypothetical protein